MSEYRPSFNLKVLIYHAIKTTMTRLNDERDLGWWGVDLDLEGSWIDVLPVSI